MNVLGGGAYCSHSTGFACEDASAFFSTDSTLNLELNVARNVRLTLGGGYRFVLVGDDDSVESSDLRGFVARMSVAAGDF